jgi:hypothetical protein
MVQAVTVQFNAFATGGAYQQWQGDLAECTGCGAQVVTRYGQQSSWEHHHGLASNRHSDPNVIVCERRGDGALAPGGEDYVRPMGASRS